MSNEKNPDEMSYLVSVSDPDICGPIHNVLHGTKGDLVNLLIECVEEGNLPKDITVHELGRKVHFKANVRVKQTVESLRILP